MKLYRYMSNKEFMLYTAGVRIAGHNHQARTTSEGVCFLPEVINDVDGCMSSRIPEECIEFLSGIVTDDVLVKFDVLDDSLIKESYGVYANPDTGDWDDFVYITEYCAPYYDRNTMNAVAYAIVDEFGETYWYEI